jgi:hypothetical protein
VRAGGNARVGVVVSWLGKRKKVGIFWEFPRKNKCIVLQG